MELEIIINSIHQIPAASYSKILEIATMVDLPAGHILLKANKIEQSVYFIKRGIVRAFEPNAGLTFWFGREGEAIVSMRSYVENKPGYENIALLEDCELYEISMAKLEQLFNTDIHIANWGRKFAEKELLKTEERLISRQVKSASQRYRDLMSNYPDLLQRVQLGYIASYLGITQVSLSRIRAENK